MTSDLNKFPGAAGILASQARRCRALFFPNLELSGNCGAVRQPVDAHRDQADAVRAACFLRLLPATKVVA